MFVVAPAEQTTVCWAFGHVFVFVQDPFHPDPFSELLVPQSSMKATILHLGGANVFVEVTLVKIKSIMKNRPLSTE